MIVCMGEYSMFKRGCKKKFQCQVLIASLHNEDLITVERVIEKIEHLRSINRLTFLVILTHRTTTNRTKISEHRVFFD